MSVALELRCFLAVLGGVLLAANAVAAVPEPVAWGAPALAKAMPVDSALAPVFQGRRGKIRMTLPRATARAGERLLDAVLEHDEAAEAGPMEWRVEVIPPGGGKPVAESRQVAGERKALARFDARAPGGGIVRARLFAKGREVDEVEALFSVEGGKALEEYPPPQVLLDRPVENRSAAWLTFGLPLPRGAVWDASALRLRDAAGRPVPAQFHSTALWGEAGSHRWLRVDALVSGNGPLQVAVDAKTPAAGAPRLQIREEGAAVVVNTGVATYRIERDGALLNEITRGGAPVSRFTPGGRGLYLVDQKGRVGRVAGKDTTLQTEFAGPLAACFRVGGIYRSEEGEELARFTVWLEFAEGRPECRIRHHLVLTRDTNEVWFKEIGWEFLLAAWRAAEAAWAPERARVGSRVEPLQGRPSLAIAQSRHRRYGGEKDEVQLLAGEEPVETTPGEMGDWAAALGADRGLLLGVREAARQHPKAFRIAPEALTLYLFAPCGGEELDFRGPALLRRWNAGGKLKDTLVAITEKLATNAVGWSKTHSLLIEPIASAAPRQAATAAGDAFTFPVEAVADPRWTYETRVVGALYPRDKKRFPDAEAFIDEAFAYWEGEQEFLGEYGFVDFFTGPHHTRAFPQEQGRLRASYTLRNAFWLLYLRSGERKFRDMASWSNRVYLDSYLAAWDGPRRTRGLYIHSLGTNDPYASLPFYWEGFTRASIGTHTNLNQFLLDYYLSGNPRAREGVLAYAEGVKQWWWKQGGGDWRILAVLRAVNHAYSLTWDPELRLIAEEILQQIYDPQSPVFLTSKGRPYENSTYKTQEDIAGLIEGWELHGTARYDRMATAVSRYWWKALEPGPRFERGRSGRFLWEKTQDPALAQQLWNAVREETARPAESSSAEAAFRFQGVPYALAAVAESRADAAPVASWAGAEVLTGRAGLVLRKAAGAPLGAHLFLEQSGLPHLPGFHALGEYSKIGLRLLSLQAGYEEATRLGIPADTEPVDLYLPLPETGEHCAFLNGASPLMLHADGWWKPVPGRLLPAARVFFRLPPQTGGAFIAFERKSLLFAPDGSTWPDEKPVSGKISLPADRAGVWSFSPVESGAVRVGGLPAFFSFEREEALFAVDPARLPLATAPRLVVEGGLAIPRGATLEITSGQEPLPFEEGTIEFFYKPGWGSFALKDPTRRRLMTIETGAGRAWPLSYVVDSQRTGWPGQPWSRSQVLEMEIDTEGPARKRAIRVRRSLFEEGEWQHVAMVWGRRNFGYTADRTEPAFDVKIFVNGSEGKGVSWPRKGNRAAAQPVAIRFGPDFEGEIAALRISPVQRYHGPFPTPEGHRITPDEQTALFFDFRNEATGVDASGQPAGKAFLQKP